MKVRVGTRGSKLAITQTKAYLNELQFHDRDYDLVIIKTVGDVRQEEKFIDMGTKGIFTKELDEALLDHKIDFAIHSLKDLPSKLHENIHLVSVSTCLDPTDALISDKYRSLQSIPAGAVIGTSSVRRTAQLKSMKKNWIMKELRGNVETRIQKMKSGQYDAIILASAGVKRMSMESEIREYLDPTLFVPCIAQGIIGVTALSNNDKIEKLLKKKQNSHAMIQALLLREFMMKAEGGCSIPLGCYLYEKDGIIEMTGYLSDPDGEKVIREKVSAPLEEKFTLVHQLLEKMEKKGFREILEKIHHGKPST